MYFVCRNIWYGEKRVRRSRSFVEVLNIDTETGDLGINELFSWEPSEDGFIKVGDSHIMQDIMYTRGLDARQLRDEMGNRKKILTYMYENKMRSYIQVSLVVQAYQSYPKMIMESVKNYTLKGMIQN